MERYNYNLIRDRLSRLVSDADWAGLPFDKSFLDQAICLGTPVHRLRGSLALRQEAAVFGPEWGSAVADALAAVGRLDPDRLDQAIILRSYDLEGAGDAYVPRNHYVLVVHLRASKMVAIEGATIFDCGLPPRLLGRIDRAAKPTG